MMAEEAARDAVHASERSLDIVIEWLVKYIGPFVLGIVGFVSMPFWGGVSSVGKLVKNDLTQNSIAVTVVSHVPFIIIFGALGGGFWHLRGEHGLLTEAIGGLAGAYFIGLALGYLLHMAMPTEVPTGLIDDAINAAER